MMNFKTTVEREKAEAYVREHCPELDSGEIVTANGQIQLQHWLSSLETMPTTPRKFNKKSGFVPYRESTIELSGGGNLEVRIKYQDRCQCSYDCAESYYVYVNFNLTTGQPATEEDYQSFNTIVNI